MADQDQDRAPDQAPRTPNPDVKDSGLPKPSAPHPESDDKDDTSRIKLEAEGGSDPEGAEDTSNIDMGRNEGASESSAADDTSRIDLASAAGKSQTARIDLSTAKRATARPSSITRPSKTARIQLGGPKAKPKDTSRIPLEKATPPSGFSPKTSGIPSTDDPSQETMRVDVEPTAAGKSKTARIELPKKPAQPTPTGRFKVTDEADGEDVFKRHTPAAPKPAAHKPAPAPRAEPEEDAPTVGVEPTPAEAAKSKTARIEMPADMVTPAAARPKTIKIKRAETTPAHAPPAAATPEAKKSGVHKSKSKSKSKSSVSSPAVTVGSAAEEGPLVTGLAAVAVVVIGILVYVLAAQTILPTLPFIGRIPV